MDVDNSKCPEKETNSYKGLIYHNHESGMREYYTEKEIQALGYKLLKWATEERKADNYKLSLLPD